MPRTQGGRWRAAAIIETIMRTAATGGVNVERSRARTRLCQRYLRGPRLGRHGGRRMSENKGPAKPRLHHVNLKTCRLDEMIAWYQAVVGVSVQHKFQGGAWLTNDAANHRIALLTSPAIRDDAEKLRHSGLHHTAFEFESYDDLLETYVRLKAQRIEPHACLDHGMTTSMYYVDPDGNSVELQADNFADWSMSSAYMRESPEFKRDPIGTPFDPRRVVAQWKEGVPTGELRRRTFAGEFRPESPLDLRFPVV